MALTTSFYAERAMKIRKLQIHPVLVAFGTVLATLVSVSAQDTGKVPASPDTSQIFQFADAVKTLAAAQSSTNPPAASSTQAQTAAANSTARASEKTGVAVESKTLGGMLSYDGDLNQAVDLLLAQQTSLTRPKANLARFRTVRALVSTLCASTPPHKLEELQAIYDHGDQAADRAQLRENEQLGRIIHMALVRSGTATDYDYRRTAAYKRIARRRFYLDTHPDEERKP